MLAAGRLPTENFLSRLNAPVRALIGTTPGKLRLLFVSDRAGLNTPPLSPKDLSDLRIYTNARVVYALTASQVAGAVAATHVYDYRIGLTPASSHSHFGVPLSCVEIKVKDTPQHKTSDERAIGELVVVGASVVGGEAALGVDGEFMILRVIVEIWVWMKADVKQLFFGRITRLLMCRFDTVMSIDAGLLTSARCFQC